MKVISFRPKYIFVRIGLAGKMYVTFSFQRISFYPVLYPSRIRLEILIRRELESLHNYHLKF